MLNQSPHWFIILKNVIGFIEISIIYYLVCAIMFDALFFMNKKDKDDD